MGNSQGTASSGYWWFLLKGIQDLGGLGKHFEKAPLDFGLDINEEKRRNLEFVKMCIADVSNSAGYLKWKRY